ncbi:hypothetical protein [Ensifer sp. SSB1]|jgi:hypothetical protein|uniref:hypothetical protein n=1 Tax=Ensifer sp. SSB1 TaxID=2795385 RepID=UPI001A62E573|nr:hypothetical protein [Ensifer sp. SSB1]MBK5566904.1 hypothetical protein [Ensifer sp. SSB1]
MAGDELKTIKFQMMLSESEAAALDDWGFANRIKSRAEVIRRLCQIGLLAVEETHNLRRNKNATVDEMIAFLERSDAAQRRGEAIDPNDVGLVKFAFAVAQAAVHAGGVADIVDALSKGSDLESAVAAADEEKKKLRAKLAEDQRDFAEMLIDFPDKTANE